jgi:predicted NBD/HSP70 family sugar kinase
MASTCARISLSRAAFGVRVAMDNDANAIALAERGDQDDVLVLKVSTGLGAGIIAGGVLQRGAAQAAGEFGHARSLRPKDFVPVR